MVSTLLNAVIAAVTAFLLAGLCVREGKLRADKARGAFRYFTTLSNAFCALASLGMLLFPASGAAWTLKYVGTATVTVTMLTVIFILSPGIGLKELLKRGNLFLHLLTPLMALVSFVGFERRGMRFATALLGMLPTLLYGIVYMYRVVFAPEPQRWEDFYGFNKNGKWVVSSAVMLAGTFAICMALMALQNIF